MKETIYEKNIVTLRRRFPILAQAIEESEEGSTDLEVGIAIVENREVLYVIQDEKQYQLDSLYESEELLDDWYANMKNDCFQKQFILFGLGNGMYVRKIMQECKDKYEIIIMEPTLEILKTAIKVFDYSGIFSSEHVYLYVPDFEKDTWKNLLYDRVNYSSIQGMLWSEYINYEVLFPTEEAEYFETIRHIINSITSSRNVQERYGKAYYNNVFSNYSKFIKGFSLLSLYTKLPKDIPAIIVAAGPSLSKNIQELKNAMGKCLMIATDSALPALLKEDIIPDLYVCVDGRKNPKHFIDERIALIPAVILLSTAICAIKDQQTHFFVSEDLEHITKFMQKEKITFPALSSGGSVANVAFALAVLLEIHTIILVGQDLAYTGNKTHAENTVRANSSIDQRTVTTTIDIHGNPILSSNEFILYKSWFEEQIRGNETLKVIDATEDGALIQGSIIKSLRETIEEECTKEVDIASCISQCDYLLSEDQQNDLKAYLGEIPAYLRNLIVDSRKSLQNYEKMYALATQHKENSGEMKRLFKYNNEIGKEIDENPVMCYVEYLMQNSIHSVLENAYKQKEDIREELIEASTIGINYTKELIEKSEWIQEDLKNRLTFLEI